VTGTIKVILAVLSCSVLLATSSPAGEKGIYGRPDAPLVAEVLGTKIHTNDPEEMKYVIVGKLMDRYAEKHDIDVKQSEIDIYVERLDRAADRDLNRHQKRRQKLTRQLESTRLTEAERTQLAAELEAEKAHLDFIAETKKSAEQNPDEVRQYREQVASAFIRQWKINRALFGQFGGRIIFQQGGPEPLDAYRMYLEDQKKKGAFTILDKSFEKEFWAYYLDDAKHSFYPSGSKAEAQALEVPWWQREPRKEQ
jgi:hypothetical protein